MHKDLKVPAHLKLILLVEYCHFPVEPMMKLRLRGYDHIPGKEWSQDIISNWYNSKVHPVFLLRCKCREGVCVVRRKGQATVSSLAGPQGLQLGNPVLPLVGKDAHGKRMWL